MKGASASDASSALRRHQAVGAYQRWNPPSFDVRQPEAAADNEEDEETRERRRQPLVHCQIFRIAAVQNGLAVTMACECLEPFSCPGIHVRHHAQAMLAAAAPVQAKHRYVQLIQLLKNRRGQKTRHHQQAIKTPLHKVTLQLLIPAKEQGQVVVALGYGVRHAMKHAHEMRRE